MTFFAKAEHKFKAVPDDGKIVTESFLAACDEVLPFFDILGPTAFAPVKSDISGNIKKLRAKQAEDPDKYKTLQDIVQGEIAEGTTKVKNSATDALLWLKRALEFMLVFLQGVLSGEQDLTVCAGKAYEETLKRYHGWLVRGVFSLAMRAVPYRKDFIEKLGQDEEVVLKDMKEHAEKLEQNINNIKELYENTGQDKPDKV